MADYDAIVVGAGLAGSTAAYCMAKEGLSVLLLDRGDTAGSKNVTGGRLYGHSLEKVIPGFAKEAPIERTVTKEVISLLTEDSCFNIDFHSGKFAGIPIAESYTVLRADFDAWLAGKAEEAGCDVVCPCRVDSLKKENGKIVGVVADEDEMTSEVVILADGVNSLLAQKEGLKKELNPHQVAVGAKQVIELTEEKINDRFCLNPGEGMARLLAGKPTDGMVGGGFIYTNKASVCVGLVVTVADIMHSKNRLPDMLEAFTQHPAIKPLLEGGKLAEYSAHLVPEGGLGMIPTLIADNLLVTGDAAGFCVNMGFTVRGMDFAVASGAMAAEAVVEAKKKNDFTAEGLASYRTRLDESFVMKDLETHKLAPDFIEHSTAVYNEFPALVEGIFLDMFKFNGNPSAHLLKKALPHVFKAGIFNLMKVGFKGVRAL